MIIEQSPRRSYFCKALGITPRTLELFEALGVVQEAIDWGVWLTGWTSFENGVENGSHEVKWDGLPFGFLALPQYDTERILETCLNRHGGSVSRGLTLMELAEDGARIKVLVRDVTGATHPIECGWLVGCDGARSTVRKGLTLQFEGDKYPIGFALGDVELDWDKPRGRAYRFTHTVEGQMRNGMVAVPVRGSTGRYRLSMGNPEPRAEEFLRTSAPRRILLLHSRNWRQSPRRCCHPALICPTFGGHLFTASATGSYRVIRLARYSLPVMPRTSIRRSVALG